MYIIAVVRLSNRHTLPRAARYTWIGIIGLRPLGRGSPLTQRNWSYQPGHVVPHLQRVAIGCFILF